MALIIMVIYLLADFFDDAETSINFSAVTFPTLGNDDVVLGRPKRMLASFETIIGIFIYGWSTAVLLHFAGLMPYPAKLRITDMISIRV